MGSRTIVRMQTYDDTTNLPKEEVDVYTIAEGVLFEHESGKVETLPDVLDRRLQLTNEKPVPAQVGNIKPGTVFTNAELNDVVKEMLYPIIAPSVKAIGTKTIVTKPDSVYTAMSAGWKVYKGTIDVAKVTVKNGKTNAVIKEEIDPIFNTVNGETTFDMIVSQAEFNAVYTDGKNYQSAMIVVAVEDTDGTVTNTEFNYTVVSPVYTAKLVADIDTANFTLDFSTAANKVTEDGYKTLIAGEPYKITFSNTLTDNRMMVAFNPADFNIYKITDANGFDITNSFEVITNVATGVTDMSNGSGIFVTALVSNPTTQNAGFTIYVYNK